MGLDCSHDAWHASYTTFNAFRRMLATAAGYDLQDLWDEYGSTGILGKWDKLPDDPLIVLLQHADCEGIIPYVVTKPLADRLAKLQDKCDYPSGDDGAWSKQCLENFIKGCRAAHAAGEDIDFH